MNRLQLFCIEGLVLGEGLNIFLHLPPVGHAGKDDLYTGKALQVAERPSGDSFLRAKLLQFLLIFWSQGSQLAASQGLHHPHGDIPLIQQLHFLLGVLKLPVQIIELELAEFHILAIGIQKALNHLIIPMGRKSQMADTPVFLLFQ